MVNSIKEGEYLEFLNNLMKKILLGIIKKTLAVNAIFLLLGPVNPLEHDGKSFSEKHNLFTDSRKTDGNVSSRALFPVDFN